MCDLPFAVLCLLAKLHASFAAECALETNTIAWGPMDTSMGGLKSHSEYVPRPNPYEDNNTCRWIIIPPNSSSFSGLPIYISLALEWF